MNEPATTNDKALLTSETANNTTAKDSDIIPNDYVETKINPKTFDISSQLNESYATVSKQPFLAQFGEGPRFLHDCLQKMSKIAAKMTYRTDKLTDPQIQNLSRHGLTVSNWILAASCAATNADVFTKYITENQDAVAFKIFINRLAHTPPQVLFPGQIKNSRMKAYNASNAWYGAIQALGSWYQKIKKQKQLTLQNAWSKKPKITPASTSTDKPSTKLVNFQDESSTKASATAMATATSMNIDRPTPSTNPPPAQTPAPAPPLAPQTKAKTTAEQRYTKTRVTMKFKIPSTEDSEGKGANEVTLNLIKSMFIAMKDREDSVAILPWTISDMNKLPAITSIQRFPAKISEMKAYTDRIRPKSNSTCWFKMHLASNGDKEHFTSSDKSDNSDWFDDNESAAYFCTVQNSDDPVSLGDFLFSGAFSDPVRIADVIHKMCQTTYNKTLHFGCRVRKVKEIDSTLSKPRVWTMADNQMVHIEVDRKEAKTLQKILHKHFNKTDDPKMRPGGYNFRVLPDKKLILSSPKGERSRTKMLKKHQAVVQSLVLIKGEDIKELDEEYSFQGESFTLRRVLLELTFPLIAVDADDDKQRPSLFHSVDWASAGADAGKDIIYCTAYMDQADTAGQILQILPAYVEFYLNRQAVTKWFNHQAIDICNEVTFGADDEGNWNGEWETSEDALQEELFEEDMGYDLQIDGLDIIDDRCNILTTDDASFNTFGTSFGANRPGEPLLEGHTINPPGMQPEGAAAPAGNPDSETTVEEEGTPGGIAA
ncbi:hypothetical protein SEMRO_1344_G264690.1 [Seminavis robusta]|uniref:Uncharacterized protein n=1 Tax=Seminavis robusta TaxID=568900 RepID=A0A9N8ELD4_9STRA|nr:hypothetical protein SEMRO_1344_G264690.1 [Seminavis robusta]|eukprot:Sro1344_g264690.1 n/a (769) ;mRNA; f:8197-10503